MNTERVKCLACNGHGGDGGQLPTGEWEFPCEVCGGRRTVTVQEQIDAQVQSSRDQGIADACAGRAARYRLIGDNWIEILGEHGYLEVCDPDGSQLYRSAFAYARAYEANK